MTKQRGIDTRSLRTPAAQERSDRYVLLISGDAGRRYWLPQGVVVVGRGDDATLVIDNESVSRTHAELDVRADGTFVRDLSSRHGTLVNGRRIAADTRLLSGDAVTLGEATLVFHDGQAGLRARRFANPTAMVDRLAEEVERAVCYERGLGLIVCALPGYVRGEAPLGVALEAVLQPSDPLGWLDEHSLGIVLPELDQQRAAEVGARVAAALASVHDGARIGLAHCPSDGCDAPSLLAVARGAASAASAGSVGTAAQEQGSVDVGERSIVVADPAMARVFALLRKLAAAELPVLLWGETGVGKENAAYAVHCWSPRAEGPFVALNCAAMPKELIESELFGHRKGAFTGATADKVGHFEAASGGTLFFDELGELPPEAQAKLLRALDTKRITPVGGTEERGVDVRIVAATNRDLDAEVEAGRFRRDLLYRLNTAWIELPPLRDRPREIPILARRFIAASCERAGRPPCTLSDASARALAGHRWPGNVRELRNAMDYAVAIAEAQIEPWHLPEAIAGRRDTATGATPGVRKPVAAELADLEKQRMVEALAETGGVKVRAADLIGMPRRTFTMKMRKYGIAGDGT